MDTLWAQREKKRGICEQTPRQGIHQKGDYEWGYQTQSLDSLKLAIRLHQINHRMAFRHLELDQQFASDHIAILLIVR